MAAALFRLNSSNTQTQFPKTTSSFPSASSARKQNQFNSIKLSVIDKKGKVVDNMEKLFDKLPELIDKNKWLIDKIIGNR